MNTHFALEEVLQNALISRAECCVCGGNSLKAFTRRTDEKTTWEQMSPVITDVCSHKKARSGNNNRLALEKDKYYNHEINRLTV